MFEGVEKHLLITKALAELKTQRSSHEPVWRDVARYIRPYRAQFDLSDAGDGKRQDDSIIDSTALYACRTFEAGMLTGVTSPSRPWLRLSIADPELAEYPAVKEWLHQVTRLILDDFQRSNLYSVLPSMYGDLAAFSNAAFSVEEDFESVIHCMGHPVGSYYIANDSKLRARVFARELAMTVRQLVERFGQYDERTGRPKWEVFSSRVKTAYDNSNYGQVVHVGHYIQPNKDWNPSSARSKFKRFSSDYWEIGSNENKFLEEKGYDQFPVLAARWQLRGTDPYGIDGPGRLVLGDTKQLQFAEEQALKLWEESANPSMKGPPSLEGRHSTSLPGGLTIVDEAQGGTKYGPTRDVNPRFQENEMRQDKIRQRIQRGFFEDIMLRISLDQRNQRATAQEIIAGQEEKFLALGTVLQQVDKDVLDPLVERAFYIRQIQKRLPPIPDELQGVNLKIEYISIMAQAQKSVGLGSYERFIGNVGQAAQLDPRALKKVDLLQWVDDVGEQLGVSPKVIRSDEAVAEMEAAEAEAAQAQAQAQAIAEGAQAAKNLAQADMSGDNALTELMGGGA